MPAMETLLVNVIIFNYDFYVKLKYIADSIWWNN